MRADGEPGDAQPAGQDPAAQDDHAEGDRPADDEQLAEVLAEQRAAELVLRGPGGVYRGLGGGVAGDVGVGQRRDDEDPAQEPDQRQHHRGGADGRWRPAAPGRRGGPATAGSSRIGTARIA